MTVKTCLTVVAGLLLAAALASAAAVILVPRLLDLDTYRAQILAMAQKALNRPISYESASFSRHLPPAVVFSGITIAEKSGDATFLEVERLTLRLAILPLLRKEVRLREIFVERPRLALARDRRGVFNIDDFLTARPSGFKIQLSSVHVRNAMVRFTDHMVDPKGFTTSLENLDLDASGLARGGDSAFRLSARIPDERDGTTVVISGTTRIPSQNESLHDAKFDVTLTARHLDAGRYWPYYGRYLPFEPVRGLVDIEGGIKGKPGEFTTKGRLRIRDLRFDYPRVFHAVLTPKDVRLACEVELTPRDLAVKSFDLAVDGLRVRGSCTLGDRHSKDPRIAARAVTSPFRLEEFRQYIPYGVIVRDTAEFIERHIKGGTYRLDDGRLDGRVSQILHMERGDNYNVLAIHGHVDKGVVTFGPRVPAFNNIRGELEMRGKDFLLRRMTGNFGGSPFSLEGQIADYPLDTPARYPFTMTIAPGEAEVAWLFRQEKPSEMAFSDRSLLRLTGSGSTADYRLTGTWDLSGADYRYRQLAHKPSGIANRLRFDARLDNSEARLADLRYELPPLELAATATYRYSGREPLTFVVTANRFRVDPHLAIFPWLQQYHPSGAVQAHIAGAGNPAEPEGIRLKGDVKLEGFSVRPFEEMKPLTDVTGTIHVTEAALETEQLTARVGDTAFTVRARLAGRAGPVGDLVFSSPELHPDDFGFHGAGQVPEVRNLLASIALKDRHLTIASLSGEVARSRFMMRGDLPDIGTPKVIMRVDFPYLRVEDLEPLARLRRTGEDQGPPADMTVQARVTSAAGSAREIPFERLDTELTLAKDQLVVTSSSVGAFGGIVSGNGRVDFVADGGPSYQAHYHLDRVDAARLLRAAGEKPLLAGVLTAEGELTARGKTPEALKRNAQASVRLRLQDGELAAGSSSEASAGTRIPCDVLDAHLTLKDEVMTVQGLNAEIFGGTVSGNGRADFAAKGGPYEAHYRLDRVDAARLLRETGIQGQLTGLLAAEGGLTFRGNTREELKNTAQGDATILLTEGVLRLPATDKLKTAHEFPFKKAQARLSFDRKALDLQSARIEAFEGVISAHGGADFSTPDGPGYRITCDLTNIAAAGFFRAVDTTRDLSGLLTLRSELTARGADVTALKRSVRGTLKVHLEKGVINKFGLISKVFSLLNVSQLLDFSLPDMVSTGMAYDHIDGNFSLQDGSVSTRDLSMHSPSLNMTLVGKTDLVSRDIDVKIGVQPLQTVGKIVNRIPIVGWILTGGKKDLIVVYYEAKGKWDDPTVSAIPSTSLSRGVSNIFRRAFNLPEEMVTEPGKVFIGE